MKIQTPSISKEDFIEFLSSATPEEVNALITEKGKPRKLYEPIIYFTNNKEDK